MKKMNGAKKYLRGTLCVTAAVVLFGAAGCQMGEVIGPEIDKNKTQIYVSAYDGGNGTDWLQDLADEWNEGNATYQVIINPEKSNTANIISNIKSGAETATSPSIYFTGEPGYQELIYGGYLENLEELLDAEVDGAGNGTVREKTGSSAEQFEEWKHAASKNGEGLYMLPFSDNMGLMVFDFDSFLEKGFLNDAANTDVVKSALREQGVEFEERSGKLYVADYTGTDPYFNYEKGDRILSAGKDGKYGTYDDGQPVNEIEFRRMINRITDYHSKSRAFIWTSEYSTYVDMVCAAAMTQYMGIEESDTYYNMDGPITVDGVTKNVTMTNGYEVYGNDGFRRAIEFMYEYFTPSNYVFGQSQNGAISHTEAQSYFLYGYKAEQENQEFAHILVDGEWYEKESRSVFNAMEKDGRGWGQREYRILFLPEFAGQKGIDGKGNGSVVTVLNNGAIIVPKQKDAAKLAAIKDFLLYTLRDTSLQYFTVKTGAMTAYRYELTETQYEQLTPFGKNCYQIHRDTENVYLSRFSFKYQTNLLTVSSKQIAGTTFPIRIKGAQQSSVIRAFKTAKEVAPDDPVGAMVAGAKLYYSLEDWASILYAAQQNGFYTPPAI